MTNPLIRETESGLLHGYADDAKKTWVWKQIPYAKPPVGAHRWRAPQDPEPWSGTRTATDEAPWALQLESGPGWTSRPNPVGGEDCLYLNIYRPQTDEENLPVYFWIHGGSNTNGDADIYDLENLAREANVVAVVIQYRLSVLGFFTHPALRASNDDRGSASGNLGTLDQIKALAWVQANIHNFGGAPNHVTIAGESAGGHNVMALMISPLAEGLFHKAVMQSGGMISHSVETADAIASQTVNNALTMKGLTADTQSAAVVQSQMSASELRDFLYGLSAEELMIAHAGGPGKAVVSLGNVIEDGHVLPGELYSLIEQGAYHKVPFMAGSNAHESGSINTLMPGVYEGMPNYYELLHVIAGQKQLDDVLPTTADKVGWTCSRDCASRMWRASMVDELVKRMRQHQEEIYVYLFEWGDESVRPGHVGFIYGAAHALEVPFMQGNATEDEKIDPSFDLLYAGMTDANRPGRQALGDAMVRYLTSFLHSGNPNSTDGPPMWEPWTNNVGANKILRLNASPTEAQIRMDSEELSLDSVRAEVFAVEQPLQEHVKAILTAMSPTWAG